MSKLEVIESLVNKNMRIRLFYGNINGNSWIEEFDTIGLVRRSIGEIAIPILLHNKTSICGCEITIDSIVKIIETKTKKVLYQHPNFTMPLIDVHFCYVMVDGQIYANCGTNERAIRLAKFLKGERSCK